ncbi:chemotaxis protein CheA [Lichenicoccus roseus]|uniref:Chemotaxis protein CheA n=1 Tax=Lichenicoccus roseus TaxID=2683649 RepID=A0A5R9J660_9PROT|nr:chemotaxis protein CheA [Lichenicoccus roseus]TLU72449.1 chemotaxis protein CheA [Lichenicoccus roseus]
MTTGHFDHLKATYFQECGELLDSAYASLTALDEGRQDQDTIHAIFRAFHSIKGGGGAFGFDRMVAFAHVLETLLDLVRDGRIAAGAPVIALLLRATDALSDLVAAERTAIPAREGFEDALLVELAACASPELAQANPIAQPPAREAPQHTEDAVLYEIRFTPHVLLYRNANEPLLLIRALNRLGETTLCVDLSRLPPLEQLEPEHAYIGWTMRLSTSAGPARIEEIFDFVSDQCDLVIEPVEAVDRGRGTQSAAVDTATAPPPPAPRRGEAHVAPTTVRVDVQKVDRLVNLVGELVINQAMLVQLGALLPPDLCPELVGGLATLSQHLRELQEGVMAIRTQPVGSVFSRMPRLVRELSAQLGKDVHLAIAGEGTEIDKTVIEQLADPLTHLLRNALDHGIETPERRIAAGKPAQGTVRLTAEHCSGRIVIEVSDDGRGIDRERVLARARQRGLVPQAATPSEEEIDNLIFLPGFSTVEVVSDVSGRGVGMDVVRRNIQALGGRITVHSQLGTGSRFVLSLPLTLAILDGMIVAVGRERYIVPLTNIIESLRPKSVDIHPVVGCGEVVAIRGDYVPLIYLSRHFDIPGAATDPSRAMVVVVESESSGQVGLVVDELLGQQQVVVKSLEENYGAVDGVGGATILGNGRVALILDVAGLRGGQMPATSGAGRSPNLPSAPASPAAVSTIH